MPKRRVLSSFVLAAMLTTALHAAAPEPEVLAASTKWNVNYADDSCRLLRAFGTGDDLSMVVFDRFAPGQDFKLMLVGKRFGNVRPGGEATVQFGPDEAKQAHSFFSGDLGKGRPALILRGDLRLDAPIDRDRSSRKAAREQAPPMSPERIAAVDWLTVTSPPRRPVRFALGSMQAPFAALDKCIANLLTKFGIDTQRHANLSRRVEPMSKPGSWLNSSDYPQIAVVKGAQGIVNFRLSVDASGTPTACHIQQSSRPQEFDKAVCAAMMRRARFASALDQAGVALASFFRGTVVFKI